MAKEVAPPKDEFRVKIGRAGGKRTMKRLGSEHYARIAELAHESRRRNKAEAERLAKKAKPAR